jgi:hypothetical protein
MARQRITRQSKLDKLSTIVGFTVRGALVRGGTGHRVDVWGDDLRVWHVWPKHMVMADSGMSVAKPRECTE